MSAKPADSDHATYDLAALQELDRRHHIHPFTDAKELNGKGARVIVRADGVRLWTAEGKELIDGMAGLWCVNVGYGREELVEAATRQMRELPYYNTFFQCTHPPATQLAAELARITPPGLNHAAFANSGSEANDAAVKLVRAYWNAVGKPTKKIMIARENAYHGVTLAAASLSGMAFMQKQFDLPMPGVEHVPAPHWFRAGDNRTPEQVGADAAAALDERIRELGPENVGAFIGEPIQGAGGLIIPPDGYWDAVQEICRRHDILLIADEVICGFGRTGNWFGSDTYGIRPDIMTMAKGLSSGYQPISAIMLGDRVADALIDAGQELAHGVTYASHPVAAAVALENIRILRDEGLIERTAAETGPYLQAKLAELADHPLVGEVRGVGLIAGLELTSDKARRTPFTPEGKVGAACREHCTAGGLVCRAIRDTMVLSPPLTIEPADIDRMVQRLGGALDATAADLKAGRVPGMPA